MSNNDLYCNKCRSHHHPVECPKEVMNKERSNEENIKTLEAKVAKLQTANEHWKHEAWIVTQEKEALESVVKWLKKNLKKAQSKCSGCGGCGKDCMSAEYEKPCVECGWIEQALAKAERGSNGN